MQQHTRPELEALTYDNLPNNTMGLIDPGKLREVLLALVASLLNLLDDGNPGAGGGGTGPQPVAATFGNLGGQAWDNVSLVSYLASLGHPLTEYVAPMTVRSGYWYIVPTGIWEAKSSFNGTAPPMRGAYWRLIASFGSVSGPGGPGGAPQWVKDFSYAEGALSYDQGVTYRAQVAIANGTKPPAEDARWEAIKAPGAAITALGATSFDVEVAVAMPVSIERYRLRAIPKTSGGGGTTTPPTQPTPSPFSSPFAAQFA